MADSTFLCISPLPTPFPFIFSDADIHYSFSPPANSSGDLLSRLISYQL